MKDEDKNSNVEVLPKDEELAELEKEIAAGEPAEIEVVGESKPSTKAAKNKRLPIKASSEVVPYDTLQAFLRDIRKYPVLSREEEKALAIQYKEYGDIEAAYKLVTSNLRLVVMISREYQRAVRNLLDLVQEGNIGLMEAVKRFDPYKGVRFPSYAVWWVRAYIVRYIIANWRMVKIGTTQAQRKLFFNLRKEQERLEREGFRPEPKLLAERLDVKESEVIEMQQRMGSPDVSVDAPLDGGDAGATLLSVLEDGAQSAEDVVSQRETKALIDSAFHEFANQLNEREQAIFEKRLLGEEKSTLADLAEEFDVSKERIRQVENRLKDKLKDFMLEKLGPSFFSADLDFGE